MIRMPRLRSDPADGEDFFDITNARARMCITGWAE